MYDQQEGSKINDDEEQYHSHPQSLVDSRGPRNRTSKDVGESMSKLEVREDVTEYNCVDLFYYSICCFKTKPNKDSSSEDNLESRYDQFLKDLDKFYKETDVINMISNIKHLKLAINKIYSEVKSWNSQKLNDPSIDKKLSNSIASKNFEINKS